MLYMVDGDFISGMQHLMALIKDTKYAVILAASNGVAMKKQFEAY